jgi:hypothetical protein
MKILAFICSAVRWRRTRSNIFRTANMLCRNMGDRSVEWAVEKAWDAWRRSQRHQAFFYEDVAVEARKQIWRMRIFQAVSESGTNSVPGSWRRK